MLAHLNRTAVAVLAGVAASTFSSVPAAAQDDDVVVRGRLEGTEAKLVSYRDLNLRRIADLNILNKRVERAVRDICDFEPRDKMDPESYQKCANVAWAGARPQIHRAYLRANHLAAQ